MSQSSFRRVSRRALLQSAAFAGVAASLPRFARAGNEPIVEVAVTVPMEFMGDITGDMSSRRGRILGMDADGGGHKETIRAVVPEAEVLRYATDLRSMTQGLGIFTLKFSHYEEVPDHAARPLIEAVTRTD